VCAVRMDAPRLACRDEMPQPQRRAGCSAIAAAADGVCCSLLSPRDAKIAPAKLSSTSCSPTLPRGASVFRSTAAATQPPRVGRRSLGSQHRADLVNAQRLLCDVTGPRHFFLCEAEAFTIEIFRPSSSGTALGTHRKMPAGWFVVRRARCAAGRRMRCTWELAMPASSMPHRRSM
jgi:hypothetical protein